MKTLRECIAKARKNKVAIGHFNISDTEGLKAVFNSAKSLNVPIIIGVSEGERDFIGTKQVVALVKSLREEYDYPIFLNADHTYSFEKIKEAVDDGFDSVIFDGASLSFEENIRQTKECVAYARKINPEILVEAELGFIGKSSKVHESLPEGVKIGKEFLTKTEEAKRFAEETGIDMIAPAVGNIHGMLKGRKEPALDIERIKEITEAVEIPIVLHGASGNTDEDLAKAIDAGVVIIHINTELRLAYHDSLKDSLEKDSGEVAPYKFMAKSVEEMTNLVTKKLKVFNKIK